MSATNLITRSSNQKPGGEFRRQWLWLAAILGATLAILFVQSFQPGLVLFVNDTTLGQMKAAANHLPEGFTGIWHPGSWTGIEGPAIAPSVSSLLALIFPPEIFLKLYAPFTQFFAGLCAWVFFRQLKFSPAVCLLGGVATGLNMHFFSIACWGLGSWNIAVGLIFLALAALSSKAIPLWARAILAGLAVGMNLMEGFDVGAILSVYVGLFIAWQIFIWESPVPGKILKAFGTEVLVIFFAALIAAYTISSLVSTQVEDVNWTSQHDLSQKERWDAATRWSLPKLETLRIIVPGLFGYRMSRNIPATDKTSAYWGTIGRDTRILDILDGTPDQRADAADKFILDPGQRKLLKSDDRQTRLNTVNNLTGYARTGARFSGSGEYAGILVSVLAFFALANSWRGSNAPYSIGERRALWFWGAAALFSLMAAWGRFFPLYHLLYQLPGVPNIRNPIKFLHPFNIAWLILAAYGMEALSRRYFQNPAQRREIQPAPSAIGSAKTSGFERKWTLASVVIIAAAVIGLILFNNWKPQLIEHLVQDGFIASKAIPMADFSIGEAFWFVLWLAVSLGIVSLLAWKGIRTKWAWIIPGVFLILDLVRSDVPWIRYFNYQVDYASNSIVDFLRDKPYEHRVTGRISPSGLGSGLNSIFGQVYNFWQQNDFPYNDIQTLDYAQWPRMPDMDAAYLKEFSLHGDHLVTSDLWPVIRLWQLTNTRYILSLDEFVTLFEKQADARHNITVKSRFKVVHNSEVESAHEAGDLTVQPDPHGNFALIDFTNALPRAKLYSRWQQSTTNDNATLDQLLSRDFDPETTVLVSKSTPVGQPSGDGKTDPGTVEITRYRPKNIKLLANAATPAVLLFNDRMTPLWKVWVDAKPAPILRCNFLMRGVFLTPGRHTIEFRYKPVLTAFRCSLCAWAVGILTAGYLIYSRKPAPVQNPPDDTTAAPQPKTDVPVKQKRKTRGRPAK
jgi:hypothetical protein